MTDTEYFTMMTSEELDALELQCDKHGIQIILVALSEICYGKAEQDAALAARWAELQMHIDKIVPKAKGL